MTLTSKNPETLVLHAGPRSDASTGAVAMPIYQTTSYLFRSTEHAANLFALKDFGNIYSRIMNPTCDALEQKIAALEGGVAALAVGSGQAASAMAVQNLCRPGDNIVSSTDLYGGTWNLFANTLPSMGITVRFADPADRRPSAAPPTIAPAPTTPRRYPILSSPYFRSAKWQPSGAHSACP
jgi:O-acetylhomoserine (thiol)-lyase